MLKQIETSYGVPGCCAATIWEGYPEEKDFLNHSFSRASLVVMSEKDFKKYDTFGGILPEPIKMDGIYFLTLSSADANKFRYKKEFQKHAELQARDGRKDDEFKEGDDIVFIPNAMYNRYKPFLKRVTGSIGQIALRDYGSNKEYIVYNNYTLEGYVLRTEW